MSALNAQGSVRQSPKGQSTHLQLIPKGRWHIEFGHYGRITVPARKEAGSGIAPPANGIGRCVASTARAAMVEACCTTGLEAGPAKVGLLSTPKSAVGSIGLAGSIPTVGSG